jgi:hypothetical protein
MSCDDTVRVKYSGATPGADTNVYKLFDSSALVPNSGFSWQSLNKARITLRLFCNGNGNLRLYVSSDRGVTWAQYGATIAVTGSTVATGNFWDWYLADFPDVKLEWENGGVAQTTWIPLMALVEDAPKVT